MKQEAIESQTFIFNAPLLKNELHGHIVTVSLLMARQLHFLFLRPSSAAHEQAQATLLGMDSTDGMNDPDALPGREGAELTYQHLANTAFATTMEALYDFAYHGIVLATGEDMNSESSPSWISRILVDLGDSHFAAEWNEYSRCLEAIKALQSVCETAEARMILEDVQPDDTFMGWHGYEGHEGLTFRQVSLLSGMSEASLRTLANPKRNNPLKTHSNGRNTCIEHKDAKAWLISKGRYVPLVDMDTSGAQLDLVNESILSLEELQDRLDSRLHFLLGFDDAPAVSKALKAIRSDLLGKRLVDQSPDLNLSSDDLADNALLKRVAKVLQLPSDLLTLKVAHLRALKHAHELQRRFEEAARKPAKNN
jgi:hypothetical protein